MHLLLISNSTNAGQEYLAHALGNINNFLGEKTFNCIFIPYASVTFSWDVYEKKVMEKFSGIGQKLNSIHQYSNKYQAIEKADVIVVGGGNTWHLKRKLTEHKLLDLIKDKVMAGTPYIGWSAGANIACPTMQTTNDMPICDPLGFNTLKLIPFQINPHYLETNPEGHAGETREQRILEYIEFNPDTYVVGLREGTMFSLQQKSLQLIGEKSARIFKKGIEVFELKKDDDASFLLS